jgi:hypothetical protein
VVADFYAGTRGNEGGQNGAYVAYFIGFGSSTSQHVTWAYHAILRNLDATPNHCVETIWFLHTPQWQPRSVVC